MVGDGRGFVAGISPHPSPLPRGERGQVCRRSLLALNDVFELVEQFLGAADAERGDQHGALVFQGLFDNGFESLAAGAAVFVEAVAVGAFEHQDVGALWGFGRHQEGGMRCAEVAGKDDALALPCLREVEVDFDIGRAEYVPGAL